MPARKKQPTQKEQKYTNTLLEDIRDKFQIILEATKPIPAIQQKLDATFEETGSLRVEVEAIKVNVDIIKKTLVEIENALSHKPDKKDIKVLVDRVQMLEQSAS